MTSYLIYKIIIFLQSEVIELNKSSLLPIYRYIMKHSNEGPNNYIRAAALYKGRM